jgi:hypothetical protein
LGEFSKVPARIALLKIALAEGGLIRLKNPYQRRARSSLRNFECWKKRIARENTSIAW